MAFLFGFFVLLLLENLKSLVFLFPEADEDEVLTDEEGALDEHTIGGEEGKHFVFGHCGEFFFEAQGFVEKTTCVEEAFQGQSAFAVPFCEFVKGGVILLDVTQDIGDAVIV